MGAPLWLTVHGAVAAVISGSLRKFAYNCATISTIFPAIGVISLINIKQNYLIFGITPFSSSESNFPFENHFLLMNTSLLISVLTLLLKI